MQSGPRKMLSDLPGCFAHLHLKIRWPYVFKPNLLWRCSATREISGFANERREDSREFSVK